MIDIVYQGVILLWIICFKQIDMCPLRCDFNNVSDCYHFLCINIYLDKMNANLSNESLRTELVCSIIHLGWTTHAHDDVINQMEAFSTLLVLCADNSPVLGEFLLIKASDAELWCFLWSAPEKNAWLNNRKTGDLRRHRASCDVIVMTNLLAVSSLVKVMLFPLIGQTESWLTYS